MECLSISSAISMFSIKVEMEWDLEDVTLGFGVIIFVLCNCALGAFPSFWEGVGIGKDGAMDGLPILVVAEVVVASVVVFIAERLKTLA